MAENCKMVEWLVGYISFLHNHVDELKRKQETNLLCIPGCWCHRTEFTGHTVDTVQQAVEIAPIHFLHSQTVFLGLWPWTAENDVMWRLATKTVFSSQAVTTQTLGESPLSPGASAYALMTINCLCEQELWQCLHSTLWGNVGTGCWVHCCHRIGKCFPKTQNCLRLEETSGGPFPLAQADWKRPGYYRSLGLTSQGLVKLWRRLLSEVLENTWKTT